MKPGPTGDFPEGKLNESDEGGLMIKVGADRVNKKVYVEFGVEIAWMAFGPTEARGMAASLIAKANEVESVTQ